MPKVQRHEAGRLVPADGGRRDSIRLHPLIAADASWPADLSGLKKVLRDELGLRDRHDRPRQPVAVSKERADDELSLIQGEQAYALAVNLPPSIKAGKSSRVIVECMREEGMIPPRMIVGVAFASHERPNAETLRELEAVGAYPVVDNLTDSAVTNAMRFVDDVRSRAARALRLATRAVGNDPGLAV